MDNIYDFIKHLRLVHFTLFLTSLGLIIATNLGKTSRLETALEQLTLIMEISSLYDTKKINSLISEKLETRADYNKYKSIYKIASDVNIQYGKRKLDNYITLDKQWYSFLKAEMDKERGFGGLSNLFPFSDIKSFKDMWNGWQNLVVIYPNKISEKAYVSFQGNEDNNNWYPLEKVNLVELDPITKLLVFRHSLPVVLEVDNTKIKWDLESSYPILEMKLPAAEFVSNWGRKEYVAYYLPELTMRVNSLRGKVTNNNTKISKIVVPVKFGIFYLNGQKLFIETLKVKTSKPLLLGTFSSIFSELNDYAENFDDIPLAKLRNILEKELHKSGEKFELFGIKLPPNTVSIWGILIIVCTQFYLFLHFKRFVKLVQLSKDCDLSAPWIGIYDSKLAKLATISTIVLLPVGASGYLMLEGIKFQIFSDVTLNFLISLILAVLSLVVSNETAKCIRSYWKSRVQPKE